MHQKLIKTPLHPLFFSAYPILFLFSINLDELHLSDLAFPLVVSMAAFALVSAIFGFLSKSMLKGAMLGSLLALLFYSFGPILDSKDPIEQVFNINISKDRILLFLGLVFTFGSFLIFRARKSENIEKTTEIFNIVGLLLVGMTIGNIVFYHLSIQKTSADDLPVAQAIPAGKNAERRDIYYIILDAYTRDDVIKDIFGGSNQYFVDALEKRGFYVARKSVSNYPRTYLSLASSLNMEYLDKVKPLNSARSSYLSFLDMIHHNKVTRYIKSRGYKYVHVGSWSPATKENEHADVNIPGPADEFPVMVLERTVLSKFIKKRIIHARFRNHILYSLDQMEKVADIPGPKYVFAHIICPHHPFHFDAKGGRVFVNLEEKDQQKNFKAYTDQLVYLNKRVLGFIDAILAKSEQKPIIIIQGDHGTLFTSDEGLKRPWKPSIIKERTAILNAYLVPENLKNSLYPTITPVNSFRLIFDKLFDADFPLLEDRSYFIESDKPDVHYDVTSVVLS